MNRRQFVAGAATGLALGRWAGFPEARADELSANVEKAVDKGLDWLVKQQQKDGSWSGNGGQFPPVMTALAGMAMLMEGSTLREGRFCERLRRAVDWLIDHTRPNGLIGNPNNQLEAQRYMYGQGYGMLFLASVYGDEEDSDRRKKLEDLLTRSVEFSGRAQNSKGGYGYVSAADGNDFAEGSVTITQLQAFRACRNAGIAVPKSIIDKATKYLSDPSPDGCTFPDGQVGYHPGRRAITPGLTTAGIACLFSAGDYSNPIIKKWFSYVQKNVAPLQSGGVGRAGHDEYTHYYYAQVLYILGDEGFGKLFPDSNATDRPTWSKYKKPTFEAIIGGQATDGSWAAQGQWASYGGPVYVTTVYLAILQLEKGVLPIYQR